jgi:phenylacetate-coenzyme A ligase PaaK-like adenylate-forming protein
MFKPNIDLIFSANTPEEFQIYALSIFRYQATQNKLYQQYIKGLKINVDTIKTLNQIPFLPIQFFKTHTIITGNQESRIKNQESRIFTSSGTTGTVQSKHYVTNISIYEKSYKKGFEHFYGNIEDYAIFALLPSYLEREGSSLIYMVNDLIKLSKNSHSKFYLNNQDEMIGWLMLREQFLQQPENFGKKNILLGVTYALLDLIEKQKFTLKNTIIMETGGMKGKREELVREQLHATLCNGFGVNAIHSEYGMTELLSQAYSKGKGVFNCPPWMKILIRDTNDPFTILSHNKTGGINVIDLANINSCSFIATQDLGKSFEDNSFEVLGRFDNSDIRGCNLLIE